MNQQMSFVQIRENERRSHLDIYTKASLYRDDSWLKKPVKTVMDILPYFAGVSQLRILDLGCGIGRNCIAIADYFRDEECHIDCVDILELAIQKLEENAKVYDVSKSINGILSPIDSYSITPAYYNWILAVSALEHVDSPEAFLRKLKEIHAGLKDNGIVCLILNSDVREYCQETGVSLPAQFEVNLPTAALQAILNQVFSGWEILKTSVREQHYEIPRENCISNLHTNVVTFVARK